MVIFTRHRYIMNHTYHGNHSGLPIILVFLAGVLFLAAVPGVSAVSDPGQSPSVIIQDYRITPAVLTAGEKGTLTVTLKSVSPGTRTSSITSGGDTASTTSPVIPYIESVTFKSKDITLLSGDSKFEGNIGPDQPVPVTFFIQAPQKNGLYFPEIWIRVRDGQSLKFPVPVNVGTQISVLRTPSLTLGNSFPGMVKPGTKIDGVLAIRNDGSSQADNIRVFINGSPPSVIPASVSSFQIENLQPDQEVRQNITLLIDKNAPTGLIQVPVDLSYAVLDGTISSQPGSIGLDIRGEAEIGITSVETSPSRVSAGTPFDLIIRVQNTGTGEAKTVDATINLSIPGVTEAFIGKIKKGNDAPATFILEGSSPGSYPYTATITYTDDWGSHTLTRDLSLTIMGGDGSGAVMIGVLLLIVLGASGVWYIRRRNGEE
jgi:hypothetical protein